MMNGMGRAAWAILSATSVFAVAHTAQADCASYCATVASDCTGANAQYAGTDAAQNCLDTCATFTNLDACREPHANLASGGPATHCPHAGPSGGVTCGTPCVELCALMQNVCTAGNSNYASTTDCEADCAGFAGAATAYTADAADTTDSFRCRMYHLTAASTDPDTHCQHAGGPDSTQGDSALCVDGGGTGGGSSVSSTTATTGATSSSGQGAGTTTSSSGSGTGGASSTGSSTSGGLGATDDDSGCNINAPARTTPNAWWLLALAPLIRRRRR